MVMDYTLIKTIVDDLKRRRDYNSVLTRNAFYVVIKDDEGATDRLTLYETAVKEGYMQEDKVPEVQELLRTNYKDMKVRVFHLTEKGAQPVYFYLV